MAYFSYLRNDLNYLLTATITSLTAATAYPLANLTILPISKPFRATDHTGEWIAFDLGSAKAVSLIGIVNHNLSATGTITVTAGTTAACADYTSPITWREFDAYKLIAAETYQYWKLTFADAANADGFIQVGLCLMGAAVSLGFNPSYQSSRERAFLSAETVTDWGVRHVAKLGRPKTYRCIFENRTQAEADLLAVMADGCDGNLTPLLIVPYPDVAHCYFVRINGGMEERFTGMSGGTMTVSSGLTFVEEVRGRKIGAVHQILCPVGDSVSITDSLSYLKNDV